MPDQPPLPQTTGEYPSDSPTVPPAEHQATSTVGRNLIFGEIARGGMGSVLKGRDPTLGRELAVKVLLEKHRNNAELVERFVEEAQIAGQLQHPGVVPVYELGRFDDNRPFFTMKLVKGQTLDTLLNKRANPRDNLPRFLTIFEQICQTVAYAHARGVVHRDLKPSNVMVGSFGEVQVMDWGLAKVLSRGETPAEMPPPAEELTQIRTVPAGSKADGQRAGTLFGMGTYGYMPPEQALGEADQIDERTDVFALGSILCVILTGQPPYIGTAEEVKRQTCRGELTAAHARLDASGVEPELARLVKDCLAPQREERPRDAGKVAATVTAYLAGVAERLRAAELAQVAARARAEEEAKARVLAEQVLDAERAKAQHERKARRLTVALATSVLLILLLGGSGGLWLKHQADTRAVERAVTEREVEGHLQAAYQSLEKADGLPEALRYLERAEARLGGSGAPIFQQRSADLRKDLEMVAKLENLRLEWMPRTYGETNFERSSHAYFVAFAEYGIDLKGLEPSEAAERIAGSPIRTHLIAALDGWFFSEFWVGLPTEDVALQQQAKDQQNLTGGASTVGVMFSPMGPVLAASLLIHESGRSLRQALDALNTDVAQANLLIQRQETLVPIFTIAFRADTDDWRKELRVAGYNGDHEALEKLGEEHNFLSQPPSNLWLLGKVLRKASARDAAVRCLRKAQQRFPSDLWITIELARTLTECTDAEESEEGTRLYQAALALRPQCADIYNELGLNLFVRGKSTQAEAAIQKAVEIDPQFAFAHCCMGLVIQEEGRFANALTWFRRGHELGSKRADWPYPSENWVRECERLTQSEPARSKFWKDRLKHTQGGGQISAATLCRLYRHHFASFRLYSEAIALRPELAADPREQLRYRGCCAALLAASGQGKDADTLGALYRTSLRQQAFDWLRADLTHYQKLLTRGKAEDYVVVQERMQHWQKNTDLASVRGDAIAKLPEAEQEGWRRLRAEVATLLKAAKEKAKQPETFSESPK